MLLMLTREAKQYEGLLKRLGEFVRTRRKQAGLTQFQLAKLAKVSVRTIYRVERGSAKTKIGTLIKILEIIDADNTVSID